MEPFLYHPSIELLFFLANFVWPKPIVYAIKSPVTSYSSLPPLPHAPDSNVHSPNEAPADTNNEQSVVEDYVLAYHDDDDDDLSYSKPYCESPGPPCLVRKRKGKQRRTLSFALLYGEGLDCINHSSADHMVLSDDSNADLMHTPMFLSSEEEEVNDNLHVPIIETSSGNVLKPRPTRRRPLQPRLQEEDIKENVSLVHAQGDEPPVTTSLTPTLDSAAVLASSTTGDALVTAQGPPKETETTLTPPAPVEDPSTRVRNKWLDYLNSVQEATDDLVENQMAEFIQVPQKVEALQSFGFMICCDSFLYVLVILPIRFIWSCLLLTIYAIVPNHKYKRPRSNSNTMTQQPFIPKPYRFHRRYGNRDGDDDDGTTADASTHGDYHFFHSLMLTRDRHMYQLIQVGIIYTIYRHVLCPISIGKLYHWIRGQEMIKLYVLVAMVEVFDRLMCSLGQDCLDSMYWNTTRQPRTWRMIISVMVVWVYATMHTLILFVHVATLNVAMNSSDQALLTLLISGNFAEIKSTVFKKYNKPQLFKVTASDICERFKLALFMGLVLILNLCQGGGMDHGMLGEFVTMCGFVWCAELLSDWIKHAFVTKYNFIKSSVYAEFGLLLAGDVTGFGHEGVNMDHSHAVVKRLGFPQIPLVCVMGRYVTEALRYFQQASYDSGGLQTQQPSTMESTSKNAQYRMILVCFGFWLVLLLIKIGLGSFLQRRCQNKLLSAPELSVTASSKKKKKKE